MNLSFVRDAGHIPRDGVFHVSRRYWSEAYLLGRARQSVNENCRPEQNRRDNNRVHVLGAFGELWILSFLKAGTKARGFMADHLFNANGGKREPLPDILIAGLSIDVKVSEVRPNATDVLISERKVLKLQSFAPRFYVALLPYFGKKVAVLEPLDWTEVAIWPRREEFPDVPLAAPIESLLNSKLTSGAPALKAKPEKPADLLFETYTSAEIATGLQTADRYLSRVSPAYRGWRKAKKTESIFAIKIGNNGRKEKEEDVEA